MTDQQQPNSYMTAPDEEGMFGIYGGRFVPETLMPLILDLEKEYEKAKSDPAFKAHALGLPNEQAIARARGSDVDPDRIHQARRDLVKAIVCLLYTSPCPRDLSSTRMPSSA